MLARKALVILLTNGVGAVLGLAALFAIARYMGPGPLGMFHFALGLVGIASFLTGLGFDQANIKRLSEGRDIGRSLGTYRRIKDALAGIFVVIAAGAALAWHHFRGFTDATGIAVVLVMVAYYAFMALRRYAETTFSAFRLTATTQLMVLVEHLVKSPAVILVALLYGFLNGRWVPFMGLPERIARWLDAAGPLSEATGAALLAAAWAAAMAVSLFAGQAQMRRLGYRPAQYDRETARSYVAFALPVAVSSSLYLVAKQIDAVMIGYFWSNLEVGYYGGAVRLTTVVLIIPMAVRTLFFPVISELASRGHTEGVHEVAHATLRILSLVMVLATALVVFYAREGIHILLADSFLPATPVLQLLAIHTFAVSLTTVSTSIVNGFDHPRATALIGLVSVAINVGLNLILIPASILGVPLFGMRAVGAALASVIAQSFALVAFAFIARRITGRFPFPFATVKHILAALLMVGVLHVAHGPLLGSVDRVWELGAAGVLGGLVYVGALILMRDVTRKDLDLVRDLAHPGRLAEYVRDELKERR